MPDGLWEIVEPLLPPQRKRPQGGGTRFVEDRVVLDCLGEQAATDGACAVVDAASVRANPRGSAGRGNPVQTFREAGCEA